VAKLSRPLKKIRTYNPNEGNGTGMIRIPEFMVRRTWHKGASFNRFLNCSRIGKRFMIVRMAP
jgi:hypothetical protein